MILGQEKICRQIDDLTIDSLPRSLMLVGPRGAGKHLIVDYISDKFSLKVLDITTTLDQEYIEELYNRVEPYLYLIRANELSVKDENTILKFIEEPLKNSYIILLAETDIGLLQTILNRCQIWYLQNYSRDTLKEFLKDGNEYILNVASTPGQIEEFRNMPFEDMVALADKIVEKINIASIANTLSISSKINFKDDKSKFDLSLFVTILLHTLLQKSKIISDRRYTSAYLLTAELSKKIRIKNLDYKSLFEKYLIELRSIMKGTLV